MIRKTIMGREDNRPIYRKGDTVCVIGSSEPYMVLDIFYSTDGDIGYLLLELASGKMDGIYEENRLVLIKRNVLSVGDAVRLTPEGIKKLSKIYSVPNSIVKKIYTVENIRCLGDVVLYQLKDRTTGVLESILMDGESIDYIDESKKIDANASSFNTIKDNNSTPTSMGINNISCDCPICSFDVNQYITEINDIISKEHKASTPSSMDKDRLNEALNILDFVSGIKESRKEKDTPKSYTNKTNPNSLIDSITEKMKDPDLTLKQKEELFGMRTIMEFLTGMSNSNDTVKPTKSFIPSKIAEEFTSKYPYPMHYEIISGKKASSVVRVIDENRKVIWLAIYKTDNITHDINSVYKKDTESYKKLTRAVALGKFLLDKLLEVVQEPSPNLTYLLKDMNFDAPVSSRLHYLASDKIIAIPIYIG